MTSFASARRLVPVAVGACAAALAFTAMLIDCGSSGSDAATNGANPDPPADDGGPLPPNLDGGGTIPEAPDGPALCPMGACNYQTGAMCSQEQTCAPIITDAGDGGFAPACTPAGAKAVGAPCDGSRFYGECVPGALCINNVCRKLCCGGDWTGCAPTEHCSAPLELAVTGSNAAPVMSGASVCMPSNPCDALDPSSCADAGAGLVCIVSDDLGGTACAPPPGTGVVTSQGNDPCPCAAGFTCVNMGCRRLCRAVEGGGEPSCPREEGQCTHFSRNPPGVGECTPLGELSN